MKTGALIVYTSADSVFQVAANEAVVPVPELYRYCEIAREMLTGDHNVGRVIARPFVGTNAKNFKRTTNRHDLSLKPPRKTMLDYIRAAGLDTIGVGKIYDIFDGEGVSEKLKTTGNANGVEVTDERAQKYDFSTPYGYIRTALIVRGDNTDIQSFEDLKGKHTANSIASTYMTLAEGYGATAAGVDTLDQTIQMVLSGRADATLNAEVSFYDYMNVHPDANLKVVALTDEASKVSMPMRKEERSASLLAAVNQAIAELDAEGELTRISEKYFGKDITKAEQ